MATPIVDKVGTVPINAMSVASYNCPTILEIKIQSENPKISFIYDFGIDWNIGLICIECCTYMTNKIRKTIVASIEDTAKPKDA